MARLNEVVRGAKNAKKNIGLSRRELNPGLERIELMFKLDKLTY